MRAFPVSHPAHQLDAILKGGCRRELVQLQMVAFERAPTNDKPPDEVGRVRIAPQTAPEQEREPDVMEPPWADDSYRSSRNVAVAAVVTRSSQWIADALAFGAGQRAARPRCEWGLQTMLGESYFWPAADLVLVDGMAPGWKLLDTVTSLAALYEMICGRVAEFTLYRTGHSFHAYANRLLPAAHLPSWLQGLGDMKAVDQKWISFQTERDQGLTLRWSDGPGGRRVPARVEGV